MKAIGGFPTQTITEDYMLSMELAKRGFKSRYLQLYMATGGNAFLHASGLGC